MVRPVMFICFAALAVCTTALPEFREMSSQESAVEFIGAGEPVMNLGQRGYMPRKIHRYHNFTNGEKYSDKDNLLFDDDIQMFSSSGRIVEYNLKFKVSNERTHRISLIEVRDLHTKENERGWAYLKSGGGQYPEAVINLQSVKNSSLAFHITVYEGVDPYYI